MGGSVGQLRGAGGAAKMGAEVASLKKDP